MREYGEAVILRRLPPPMHPAAPKVNAAMDRWENSERINEAAQALVASRNRLNDFYDKLDLTKFPERMSGEYTGAMKADDAAWDQLETALKTNKTRTQDGDLK